MEKPYIYDYYNPDRDSNLEDTFGELRDDLEDLPRAEGITGKWDKFQKIEENTRNRLTYQARQ